MPTILHSLLLLPMKAIEFQTMATANNYWKTETNLEMIDIINLDDVKLVVDCFYEKVRNDEQLKDVFNDVIQDRWPTHLENMYRFWQTVFCWMNTPTTAVRFTTRKTSCWH